MTLVLGLDECRRGSAKFLLSPSFGRMLTNSRDIKRRLEQEGWVLDRVSGSHHVFKHSQSQKTIVLPHPRKDLGPGLVRNIYRQAGWKPK